MKNTEIAAAYYTAMGNKNIQNTQQYLHENVEFVGPLARLEGKKAVAQSVESFMKFFNSLTIRIVTESKDNVMLAYDLDFPPPIGSFHSAALLHFSNGLIDRIELFYNARPFETQRNQIFSKSS